MRVPHTRKAKKHDKITKKVSIFLHLPKNRIYLYYERERQNRYCEL